MYNRHRRTGLILLFFEGEGGGGRAQSAQQYRNLKVASKRENFRNLLRTVFSHIYLFLL